ncbi:MAG: tyrosine recombinase XerC [Ruminococcus sp.]|nr:tyrosine recombinase XerC [Ruminococcus sp.]
MAVNFMEEAPDIIKEFLLYMQNIKGRGLKTIDEYYIDLRTFFRYINMSRKISSEPFDEISIDNVDVNLIKSITLRETYEFMYYLQRERNNGQSARARKTSSLRQFYKYLERNHIIDSNPIKDLETPKRKKSLPKYLTLEQSIELLNAVEGDNYYRDYCILTLFLNCGLRLSELCGLNYNDIRSDNTMRVLGKGNKERIIYLNKSCIDAINAYKEVRPVDDVKDKNALFISRNHNRMSPKTVQAMVYKYLEKIGLNAQGYSCHKLRHTAATLMYQTGDVDIRVLKDILGHENLGTTEIYTHLSNRQLKEAAESNPLGKIKSNHKDGS